MPTPRSDALWAGLPVLTCIGETFPARVAASLLHAVGLPELITHSLEEYEELAVRAGDPAGRTGGAAGKAGVQSPANPLFDTERFARHLERAYEMMLGTATSRDCRLRRCRSRHCRSFPDLRSAVDSRADNVETGCFTRFCASLAATPTVFQVAAARFRRALPRFLFGRAWSFVLPLLSLLVFTIFFGVILKMRWAALPAIR